MSGIGSDGKGWAKPGGPVVKWGGIWYGSPAPKGYGAGGVIMKGVSAPMVNGAGGGTVSSSVRGGNMGKVVMGNVMVAEVGDIRSAIETMRGCVTVVHSGVDATTVGVGGLAVAYAVIPARCSSELRAELPSSMCPAEAGPSSGTGSGRASKAVGAEGACSITGAMGSS